MNIDGCIKLLKGRISSLLIYDEIEQDLIKFASKVLELNDDANSIILTKVLIEKIIKEYGIELNYLKIITALTHPDVDFLRLEYLLFIDDESIELSNEDMQRAYDLGFLRNPKDPDLIIENYMELVAPIFLISKNFIKEISQGKTNGY
ncbi:hypothetical protein N5580_21140 (plasmid) [Pantoea piersonii]|uniref:Uncharacterized protein n=1 Tax=Pantoea piersonii TaxID=2364647 RepID=A0AAJ5QNZ7_9GAMM|nr:hypothetical protein [Pantoea piersonii]WBG93467.1 hypothetical protein N5580_21140 [Pantoea piersonii]